MSSERSVRLAEDVLLAMAKREPNVPGDMYSVNWFCERLKPSVTSDEVSHVAALFNSWGVGKITKMVEGEQPPKFGVTMTGVGLDRAKSIAASRKLSSKLVSDRFQKMLNVGAFLVSLFSLAVAGLALFRTSH